MEDQGRRWSKWHKMINIIMVGSLLVLFLSILDGLYFRSEGISILHPYLDIFLAITAVALLLVALMVENGTRKTEERR